MQEIVPVELSRSPRGLVIKWSDGRCDELEAEVLQQQCPCATCRERAKGESQPQATTPSLPILGVLTKETVAISKMEPVGNYAYSIHFSRGCSKGIYTLDLLRAIGELKTGG